LGKKSGLDAGQVDELWFQGVGRITEIASRFIEDLANRVAARNRSECQNSLGSGSTSDR
jgi:hypothetical protein